VNGDDKNYFPGQSLRMGSLGPSSFSMALKKEHFEKKVCDKPTLLLKVVTGAFKLQNNLN